MGPPKVASPCPINHEQFRIRDSKWKRLINMLNIWHIFSISVVCIVTEKIGLKWSNLWGSGIRMYRVWVPKFATGLIYQIEHSLQSIWVTRLLLLVNSFGDHFGQRTAWSPTELYLIWCISPVANFGTHPLGWVHT